MRNFNQWSSHKLIQMLKLADKDIKIMIITVFCIFKKLEERSNITRQDMEDVLKPNGTFRYELERGRQTKINIGNGRGSQGEVKL